MIFILHKLMYFVIYNTYLWLLVHVGLDYVLVSYFCMSFIQVLDGLTLRNLDVADLYGSQEGTLLSRLNQCSTPFGRLIWSFYKTVIYFKLIYLCHSHIEWKWIHKIILLYFQLPVHVPIFKCKTLLRYTQIMYSDCVLNILVFNFHVKDTVYIPVNYIFSR